jgi:hypothetical protein
MMAMTPCNDQRRHRTHSPGEHVDGVDGLLLTVVQSRTLFLRSVLRGGIRGPQLANDT